MQCEEARDLIGGALDHELAGGTERAVRKHLEDCTTCSAAADDLRRLSRELKSVGRQPAPAALVQRVREALSEESGRDWRPWRVVAWSPMFRQAASLAAVCLLSVCATWFVLNGIDGQARIEDDLVSAHVRSLLQDSPIQVASGDPHSVKPWFNGRLEFSPNVRDLSPDGFPLAGARLDYVAGRRVGVLVYRRRQHLVNVFVWPSSRPDSVGRSMAARDGYNIISWSRGGLAYWAVSDLNSGELHQLQALL